MKMTRRCVLILGLLLAPLSGAGLAPWGQSSKPVKRGSAAAPLQSEAEHGERAFHANCSRCHYAPDTLNPRISGTVIRHMRVRANLSAADERAILHYLNP